MGHRIGDELNKIGKNIFEGLSRLRRFGWDFAQKISGDHVGADWAVAKGRMVLSSPRRRFGRPGREFFVLHRS